jgi:hypothetical protein
LKVEVNVHEGERVRAGDPLIDGPIDPHDVLAVLGIKEGGGVGRDCVVPNSGGWTAARFCR